MLELLIGLYKTARDPVLILKKNEIVSKNHSAIELGEKLSLPEEFCEQTAPFVGSFIFDGTEYQAVVSAAGEYRVCVLYRVEQKNRNVLAAIGASIKNSIATIQMAANFLNKEDTDLHSRYYRNVMNHQIHSINRLAGNMMYIGGENVYISNESVDLVELYSELVDSVNILTNGEKALVCFFASVNELNISGDSVLLERLLLNLLSNSLKATPEDGKIIVSIDRKANRAIITVKDSGSGIPENILSHLFSSYDVVRSLSESYQSIGMGLSVVQDIARRMGGTIMAKSEVGKGSVFTVSLPILQKDMFCSPSTRYGAKSMKLLQTELSEVLTAECYGDVFND